MAVSLHIRLVDDGGIAPKQPSHSPYTPPTNLPLLVRDGPGVCPLHEKRETLFLSSSREFPIVESPRFRLRHTRAGLGEAGDRSEPGRRRSRLVVLTDEINGRRNVLLFPVDEAIFFPYGCRRNAPPSQIDQAQSQADKEDGRGRVLDEVQPSVLFLGLVDRHIVNHSRDDSHGGWIRQPGHHFEVRDGNHRGGDQASETGQQKGERYYSQVGHAGALHDPPYLDFKAIREPGVQLRRQSGVVNVSENTLALSGSMQRLAKRGEGMRRESAKNRRGSIQTL